jgi:hypothetical protein
METNELLNPSWIVSNVWKDTVAKYLKALSKYFPVKTEQNLEHPENSR